MLRALLHSRRLVFGRGGGLEKWEGPGSARCVCIGAVDAAVGSDTIGWDWCSNPVAASAIGWYERGHFGTSSGRHVGIITDVKGVLAMAVKLLVRPVSLVSRWVKHVGATVYVWFAPVRDTTLYGRA